MINLIPLGVEVTNLATSASGLFHIIKVHCPLSLNDSGLREIRMTTTKGQQYQIASEVMFDELPKEEIDDLMAFLNPFFLLYHDDLKVENRTYEDDKLYQNGNQYYVLARLQDPQQARH